MKFWKALLAVSLMALAGCGAAGKCGDACCTCETTADCHGDLTCTWVSTQNPSNAFIGQVCKKSSITCYCSGLSQECSTTPP